MPTKFGSALLGNNLVVYDNRVEIISGCSPFRRKLVIPFSSIASVDVPQLLNMVVIRTNDGKKHNYTVGNAKKIQQAIIEKM